MIALGYKDSPEIVRKIDCIVMERRRSNPAVTYSRAKFLKEAVARELAAIDVTPPQVRTRTRESLTVPVKPVALAARGL